jgi:hypothetical protein
MVSTKRRKENGMKREKSFTSCNNFDTRRCPQKDHEDMKKAFRFIEGEIVRNAEEAFKANELCKVCDKFTP